MVNGRYRRSSKCWGSLHEVDMKVCIIFRGNPIRSCSEDWQSWSKCFIHSQASLWRRQTSPSPKCYKWSVSSSHDTVPNNIKYREHLLSCSSCHQAMTDIWLSSRRWRSLTWAQSGTPEQENTPNNQRSVQCVCVRVCVWGWEIKRSCHLPLLITLSGDQKCSSATVTKTCVGLYIVSVCVCVSCLSKPRVQRWQSANEHR